jgi:hypothetical protein
MHTDTTASGQRSGQGQLDATVYGLAVHSDKAGGFDRVLVAFFDPEDAEQYATDHDLTTYQIVVLEFPFRLLTARHTISSRRRAGRTDR